QGRKLVVPVVSRLTGADRHSPKPNQIRYSPPTIFKAVNQLADAWISAPSPKAQSESTRATPSTPPVMVHSVLPLPGMAPCRSANNALRPATTAMPQQVTT